MTSKKQKGIRSVADLLKEAKVLLDTIQATDVRTCNEILDYGGSDGAGKRNEYERHIASLMELEVELSKRASDIQELRQALTAAYESQAELRRARTDINGFKPKGCDMWTPELKYKLAELMGAIAAVNDAANDGDATASEQDCVLSLAFVPRGVGEDKGEGYCNAFTLNRPDSFDIAIRPNMTPHPFASHEGDNVITSADLLEAHRRGKSAEHVRLVKEGLASARPGTTIRIVHMEGEPHYEGRIGVVESTDDAGQIHGTWGGCAIQPERDTWEVLREP